MEGTEPSVRGRLNQLVQMFENRATQREETSCSAPVRSKKLPASKLQSVGRDVRIDETVVERRRVDTSMFSVNKLIETFDARPKEGDVQLHHTVLRPLGAGRKCQSSGDLRRRECAERSGSSLATDDVEEWHSEVQDLVEEIFANVLDKCAHERRRSCTVLESQWSTSERDLMAAVLATADDARSVITDETSTDDTESCTSPGAPPFMFSHHGGKIGALWSTREAFPVFESTASRKDAAIMSDVSELCTKKLSQYMNSLGARLALDASSNYKTVEDYRTAIKDTVKLVVSRMEGDAASREEDEDASCEKAMDVSVRTCKALIEMTVFEGEALKPTINVINRAPSTILSDDDDDLEEGKMTQVLFSTDDLNL